MRCCALLCVLVDRGRPAASQRSGRSCEHKAQLGAGGGVGGGVPGVWWLWLRLQVDERNTSLRCGCDVVVAVGGSRCGQRRGLSSSGIRPGQSYC